MTSLSQTSEIMSPSLLSKMSQVEYYSTWLTLWSIHWKKSIFRTQGVCIWLWALVPLLCGLELFNPPLSTKVSSSVKSWQQYFPPRLSGEITVKTSLNFNNRRCCVNHSSHPITAIEVCTVAYKHSCETNRQRKVSWDNEKITRIRNVGSQPQVM